MQTLTEQIDNGTLWTFPGGIHPPENKTLSNQTPIDTLPLPEHLYIPVTQHIGQPGSLLVKVGDKVLKGQPLTQPNAPMALPVHAPTSGIIEAIGDWASTHPSGLPETTITLKPDGEDRWCALTTRDSLAGMDNTEILAAILNAGIAGLGGATFPSHIKLSPIQPVKYLLINAAECEPYITADDTLMREFANEIVQGLTVLDTLLSPERILFAIEDNKPQAIAAIEQAVKTSHFDSKKLQVKVIPTKYPSGSEKQLVQILTGQEVPSGKIPAQLGMVMQNVGSLFAIKRALFDGEPLIERVVTVTGQRTKQPGNYWVRLGSPIDWLLKQTRFNPQLLGQKVIIGGPMMGFTLPSLKAPVTKATNCILVPSRKELPGNARELNCIRCGECAQACPQQLLPQQLYWHAKAKELDKAEALNLRDCIECGACAYVCPSDIPLVQYYRIAKSALRQEALKQQASDRAKIRFDARQARLEKEKQERENRHKAAAAKRKVSAPAADSDAVQAALARIKKAKPVANGEQDMAALRAQRKAEARARKAGKAATDTSPASTDPKQDAVAAAIARAKAKKAAQSSSAAADPNKAAVAAAIARAKAKQAAAKGDDAVTDTPAQPAVAAPKAGDDKRKAAVAAAIAKAKAKQAAAKGDDAVTGTPAQPAVAAPKAGDDKRKAAVAAAIGKAKAKQAAARAHGDDAVTGTPAQPAVAAPKAGDDKRKAAVAAAIAKAKAKQAAAKGDDAVTDTPAQPATPAPKAGDDKRKAAVAAAIGKAKAKQAAAKGDDAVTGTPAQPAVAAPKAGDDKRKAAVAAAIAKAKAKQAAANSNSEPVATTSASDAELVPAAELATESDPKKAAIARAIAKAKAKQAADSNGEPISTTSAPDAEPVPAAEPATESDPKKAAIARAIAKAKAKQQAQRDAANKSSDE
ncbi:electron transport complex protein RnfC [Ferrimonas sediminum]|uniref:Ion-translocating oxidoreductase complex subunit C n=1 Tax=Ferrimonas sediminum TaxID=718193 RepID=A0A1G9B0B8_9GAMM|nr:electron transport complex subunit RsxC [Ferrimonas sediminum]SDK33031.1 electron transport complex protein RnfC [Ferrimonas sediminum]